MPLRETSKGKSIKGVGPFNYGVGIYGAGYHYHGDNQNPDNSQSDNKKVGDGHAGDKDSFGGGGDGGESMNQDQEKMIKEMAKELRKLSGIKDKIDEVCSCEDEPKVVDAEFIDQEHPVTDDDPHDYTQMTDEMVQRIRSGEHYLEVINDIARLYAETHSSNYDAYDFAHDALSRRAWEMGLWPEEDSEDAERRYDYHDSSNNLDYADSRYNMMAEMKTDEDMIDDACCSPFSHVDLDGSLETPDSLPNADPIEDQDSSYGIGMKAQSLKESDYISESLKGLESMARKSKRLVETKEIQNNTSKKVIERNPVVINEAYEKFLSLLENSKMNLNSAANYASGLYENVSPVILKTRFFKDINETIKEDEPELSEEELKERRKSFGLFRRDSLHKLIARTRRRLRKSKFKKERDKKKSLFKDYL